MNDFIIIGDTEQYKDCLIYVCGPLHNMAEEVLDRILNNPTENDKRSTEGMTNLRIKEVPEEDCWWRYGCD